MYEPTVFAVMDEPELVQFVLGRLSEEERERIERKMFADDEFFERLCAVENELVRDYLHRKLPPSIAADFERRLTVSPNLRRRTEDARGLMVAMGAAPRTAVSVAGEPPPWWGKLFVFSQPVYGAAWVCVAVTAVVVAIWFGVDNRHLRVEVAGDRVAGDRVPGGGSRNGVSFLLTAGATMRGGGTAATPLRIPPGAGSIHFDLELRTKTIYREFRAELRDVDQETALWSGSARRSRTPAGTEMAALDIPGPVFARADYVLSVKGLAASGEWEDLPSYAFGVVR
jgi:hypothetical protein